MLYDFSFSLLQKSARARETENRKFPNIDRPAFGFFPHAFMIASLAYYTQCNNIPKLIILVLQVGALPFPIINIGVVLYYSMGVTNLTLFPSQQYNTTLQHNNTTPIRPQSHLLRHLNLDGSHIMALDLDGGGDGGGDSGGSVSLFATGVGGRGEEISSNGRGQAV